jgi:hypothetical protein
VINARGWACADGYSTATTPAATSQRSEVVVDEGSSGFARGGQYWWDAGIGYGGHMLWTYVNGNTTDSWASWSANLADGRYEVYAFVPRDNATTRMARYEISHSGGTAWATVNQSVFFDAWVSLGTYGFSGGSVGRIRLTDATGEAPNSGLRLGLDAVRFVPR